MILYADYGNENLAVTAFIVSTTLCNLKENQTTHVHPFHWNPGPVIVSSAWKTTNTHIYADMPAGMVYIIVRYRQHCLKYHYFGILIFLRHKISFFICKILDCFSLDKLLVLSVLSSE